MPLTPGESDRLLLHLQASLAQRRRDRGLALNVPEARALIADAVCEWARDGLSWRETRDRAARLLGVEDVLPGVADALTEIRVEARFEDGTRLVVVKDPFGVGEPADSPEPPPPATGHVSVRNEADTAIGLTSHIHLAEVNPRLRLDRSAAFGMRPAVSTGETIWIVPGETVVVPVLPITGARIAVGTSGAVDGALDDPSVRARALQTLRACGYLDVVDGDDVGTVDVAQTATASLMRALREREETERRS